MNNLPLIELFYDEKHITTIGTHLLDNNDNIYQLPSNFKQIHPELFEFTVPKKIKLKVNGKVIENWKLKTTEFGSILLHVNTESVISL